MNAAVMSFLRKILTEDVVRDKDVLEVGSFNVNGSARDIVSTLSPATYVGVDMALQPGYVDEVVCASNLTTRFGGSSWDVVVSTEMLEHTEDWEAAVSNMKSVVKPGGLLVVTARSPGFPYHGYTNDYWRFRTVDVAAMFSDFVTLHLADDPSEPGFMFAGRRQPFSLPPPNPDPVQKPESMNAALHQDDHSALPWSPAAPPVAFYHVAALGHWRDIVTEQLSALKNAGFDGKVHIGFIGAAFEDGFIRRVAEAIGIDYELRLFGSDMSQFEFPTLRWCHQYCQDADDGAVLYFHGKSVTNTKWQWVMWRWLMNAYNLIGWERMVESLGEHNCAGVSWVGNSSPAPHFPGNFWWARASFVKQLTPVDDYRVQYVDWARAYAPAWRAASPRHAAEYWFNSRVNAAPFVAGPDASRFWDHAWWAAPENSIWNAVAYWSGAQARVRAGASGGPFDRAFAPVAHPDANWGCDKTTTHSYGPMYDENLGHLRGTSVKLLEIGVLTGAGLVGWRAFLGDAATIVGVDIDLAPIQHVGETVYCCDATTPACVELLANHGSWDVIIDDGSHILDDQKKSFDLLWDSVTPGGLYFVEDIELPDEFMLLFPDAELYDTREQSGRFDDVCAVFRKPLAP